MARKSTNHRRAWGQIRRLPSGNYQASYLGPDGCRHIAALTYSTRSRAEGWLNDERRLIENREWSPQTVRAVAATTITAADYADEWLRLKHRTLKPRTVTHYRAILDTYIKPAPLGALPMGYLTAAAVRTWYAGLDSGAPTMRAHTYGLLHAICATAVDDELIAVNPCRIKGAIHTSARREPVILTPGEVAAVADAIEGRYRGLVLIAAWCGLRWGEVTELRRKDIGVGAEAITVARGVTHRGGCNIDTPKSGKGRRVVVPPHIRADIKHHLDTHTGADAEALLFTPPRSGCHLSDRTFRYYFTPALAQIGRTGVRIHDLRHFAGTQAARVGNLVETMNHLGHSTVAASLRYQHMVSGRDVEIADALSALAENVG